MTLRKSPGNAAHGVGEVGLIAFMARLRSERRSVWGAGGGGGRMAL